MSFLPHIVVSYIQITSHMYVKHKTIHRTKYTWTDSWGLRIVFVIKYIFNIFNIYIIAHVQIISTMRE